MFRKISVAIVILILGLWLAETYFKKNGKYACHSEMTGLGGYISPYTPWIHSWYYRYYPDSVFYQKKDEYIVKWKSNKEGFKDKPFVTQKDKIRVITLGDSFTEGQGADNDSSLAKNLAYLLRDSMAEPTEVWNCGMSGSDPVFEYRIYHDLLLKYHPDMVIVVINSSDVSDMVVRGGFERFDPDSTVHFKKGPWFEGLYAESYIFRRIVHDVFRYNWLFIPPGAQKASQEQAIHDVTAAIDSFAQSAAANKIKLLFVFHPSLSEYSNLVPYEIAPAISYCRQLQLPYTDISEQRRPMHLSGEDSAGMYWVKDGHYTNKGYRYMAKSIWRRVYELLKGS